MYQSDEIGLYDLLDSLCWDLLERREFLSYASVVDEHIDGTEVSDDLLYRLSNLSSITYVTHIYTSITSSIRQCLCTYCLEFSFISSDTDDGCVFFGESERNLFSDAVARSGNHYYFAGEVHGLV